MSKGIVGLDGRFVHKLAQRNTIPQTGFADQQDTVRLVEDRTNEISIPLVLVGAVSSREMAWNDGTNTFIAAAGLPTRISEFVKQINKRYLGSATLNATVVTRVEAVDADTGNRLVFTPGATTVGSLQDFEVIIPDQDGDYESRGFLLTLAANANTGALDGGGVIMRLSTDALPW